MLTLIWIVALTFALAALAYLRAPGWSWAAAVAALLVAVTLKAGHSPGLNGALWTVFIAVSAILLVPPLRRALVSDPLLGMFRKVLPQVSQTEQEALDAGTVWWDGELFSGKPDWNKLLVLSASPRSAPEEQAFLDGPVEELCRMCDDWEITHELNDLPPRRLAVHQGQGLPRDDHPEAVRRARLLRARAFAGGDEARHAQRHGMRVGDGAELARARPSCCCTTAPRSRRTITCRASRRAGDAVLRADEPGSGLGRGRDSRLRHRVPRHARGQRSARHAR